MLATGTKQFKTVATVVTQASTWPAAAAASAADLLCMRLFRRHKKVSVSQFKVFWSEMSEMKDLKLQSYDFNRKDLLSFLY